MYITRKAVVWEWSAEDFKSDPLTQKLRKIILTGREPSAEDRIRAAQYNIDNVQSGLPYRAPVR